MLPVHLLPKISPNACKLYFVLLAHLEPGQDAPIATVRMTTLCANGALSARACCRALSELCNLSLLRRLPYAYHQVHSYLFLPIPGPPSQSTDTASPLQAALLNPSPTKTQATPPQATLLNQHSPAPASPDWATLLNLPATTLPLTAGQITPEFLRALAAKVAPEKRPKILAVAAHLEHLIQTRGTGSV